MTPRIGYYAHHHGSGHRHRARLVSRAYPGPVDVLSSCRDECVTVPLPMDVADDAEPGTGHPDDADAHGRLHFAPLRSPHLLAPRAEAIVAWVRRSRPALVVVDVSVEVAVLLRLVGVPVVLVRQHGDRRDAGHTLAHDIATSLLAPYPEWAEDPTATPAMRAKTTYTGGFSRFDGRPGAVERAVDEVVVMAGTGGTTLSREQLQVLAATDDRRWTVLGLEGPSDPDVGLHLLGNVDDPWPHLRRAGVAVVSAGHSALCEVAAAGTPTVAVAEDRPFDEQHHKVRVLDAAGAVVAAPTTPPASDPRPWITAIDLAQRSARWRAFVDHQGLTRAADHLVRLVSALTPEPQPTHQRSTSCQQRAAHPSTSAAV